MSCWSQEYFEIELSSETWSLAREPMSTPESQLEAAHKTRKMADDVSTDVSHQTRTQSLLLAQRRTLEMIADGASLAEILEDLCRTIDSQNPEIISTVLLMDPDGKRLWPAAGPRVPASWTRAITPLTIGPRMGSCGTAAFLKQPVIISDIANDPLFDVENYRGLALSNGLRASWSQPLLSKSQEVLGTFAMYYNQPRSPIRSDLELIDGAAQIARIAIELKQAEDKLRRDERELRQIVDAIPQTIVVLGPDGTALYANQEMLGYTGLTMEDVMAANFRERVFHPEDVDRLRDQREKALLRGEPFENEQRARSKEGKYRWFLIRYKPLHDDQGQLIRWYATGTDIDDRKQMEERTRNENLALREEIDRSSMFEEIVGSSEALRRVLAQVEKVAQVDSTVLIQGETGTGKELIARAIHKKSSRSGRAFIRVNCAAIPPSLIASELFGHEKGAFTGALQRRLGRFESANGGTIFLDEIGEVPAETQIALLRVLQEREFERIGSSQPISVDVRVVAATNSDLKAAVAAHKFRPDLFYRLNVFPVQVPSLRERVDDIPLLVEYLIDRYAKKTGKKIRNIKKRTMELFQAYSWPGNIRELQNVIERAVILCDGETFSVDETWLKRESNQPVGSGAPIPGTFAESQKELAKREKEMIEAALAACQGRISGPSGAAARLGIPRQTLDSRIRTLQINKHRFKTT